jgi:hypothetical protein
MTWSYHIFVGTEYAQEPVSAIPRIECLQTRITKHYPLTAMHYLD